MIFAQERTTRKDWKSNPQYPENHLIMHGSAAVIALFLLLVPVPGSAQTGPDKTFLQPLKTDRPPVIDGRLDDPVWKEAPSVTDFETFIPEFGKKQPEKTIAYMAYDRENLYFAFRCFDDQPGEDQGRRLPARRRPERRLRLHQPGFLQRPAVALRVLRQPAGHPGRQPLRLQQGGLQRRHGLVQRRPDRRPGVHGRDPDPAQEHPLRPRRAGGDGRLLRADDQPPPGARLLSAPRSEAGLRLPDPDGAHGIFRAEALHPPRAPAGLHLQPQIGRGPRGGSSGGPIRAS